MKPRRQAEAGHDSTAMNSRLPAWHSAISAYSRLRRVGLRQQHDHATRYSSSASADSSQNSAPRPAKPRGAASTRRRAGRQRSTQRTARRASAAASASCCAACCARSASSTIQRGERCSSSASSGTQRPSASTSAAHGAPAAPRGVGRHQLDRRWSSARQAASSVGRGGQRAHQREQAQAAEQRRSDQRAQPPADPARRAHAWPTPRSQARSPNVPIGAATSLAVAWRSRVGRQRVPSRASAATAQRAPRQTRPCLLASTAASARLETLSFL